MPDNKIRLQKYLSEKGVASRRKSEEMIRAGVVRVNGRVAHIGDSISPSNDMVTVNGKKIKTNVTLYYILLNKPRGYVTTTDDEMGRKCVTELVSDIGERLYPVGRLDKVSEGALLMTNDGELTNLITHPSHHIPKVYRVTVKSKVTKDMAARLESGVELDGVMTAPAIVHIICAEDDRSVLEITIYEGRNRQIRRMCESLDLTVSRLKRTQVGPIKLGTLPQGKYRELTDKEKEQLFKMVGKKK